MARSGAFENGKAKRLNSRTVGVLGDRQDEAVVLLRRSLVLTVMVAIVLAATRALSLNVGEIIFEGSGKLLKKMMHAVWRGRGDKKPKRGDEAQI